MRRLQLNFAAALLLGVPLMAGHLSGAETVPRPPSLTLPKLTEPELRPPRANRELEIPAAFFGCWEGNPTGFDQVMADPATRYSTRFRRIVFCYNQHSIVVPEIDLRIIKREGVIDFILSHLGLGYVRSRFVNATSDVFKVTDTQVLSRTVVTLEVTESWIYKFPSTHRRTVIDEELATIDRPNSMLVSGRQFFGAAGHRAVASWHTSFRHW